MAAIPSFGNTLDGVGALRLTKLGVGRDGLAVIFNMRLGRFRSVVHCVFVVTTC
jgi:hypothetical protein